MRNQAENGYRIIDETGLNDSDTAKVVTARGRKRIDGRADDSRRIASASSKGSLYVQPSSLPPLWTGFYAGVNAGHIFGGGSSLNTTAADAFDTGRTFFGAASAASATSNVSLNNSGFIGGGQIGYNYQFADGFVAGIEADIQGLTVRGADTVWGSAPEKITNIPLVTTTDLSKSLRYLGTVRGRVGYLITPTLLAYATGGLAYGGASAYAGFVQAAGVDPTGQIGSASGKNWFSDTHTGWTVGGGGEWLFYPHWSAKLEYLYYDLGGVIISNELGASNLLTNGPLYASILHSSTRFNGHVVRVGLNYQLPLLLSATPVFGKY